MRQHDFDYENSVCTSHTCINPTSKRLRVKQVLQRKIEGEEEETQKYEVKTGKIMKENVKRHR